MIEDILQALESEPSKSMGITALSSFSGEYPERNSYKIEPREYTEETKYEHVRRAVLKRDNHTCQECGSQECLHVHHILERSKGGTDKPSNLITLCYECHAKKHPNVKNCLDLFESAALKQH